MQALISDIHGNRAALDAVMRDIESQSVDIEAMCGRGNWCAQRLRKGRGRRLDSDRCRF
jgi:hypothetical protein